MTATPAQNTIDVKTNSLPSLRALRLEIRTRWRRPTEIPGAVIANVLRGALGITFRKLVCPEGWLDHDCPPCPLYAECAYGRLFAPTPPEDAPQLRNQQDLPRPFLIEPPGLHPDDRPNSSGLLFHLVLFGVAIEWLPYFVSTLDRLGADGLGRDRVPFDIEHIAALHPAGDETLYTGGASTVRLPQRELSTADLLAAPWPELAAETPPEPRRRILAKLGLAGAPLSDRPADPARPRIQVQFLTPTLMKAGSGQDANGRRIPAREIRDRPPFGVIIRRLRDRLSSLCAFYGERWQHPDFAALGAQADTVELIHSQTQWLTRTRTSTRTGQSHQLSGLIGKATYEFPDQATCETLTPLLRIGELIHVGKCAPWGNGALRVLRMGP